MVGYRYSTHGWKLADVVLAALQLLLQLAPS